MSTLVPTANKAIVMNVPLELVHEDFLLRHGKPVVAHEMEESEHLLRQPHLPPDSRILFAYLEEEDNTRRDVLAAVLESLKVILDTPEITLPEEPDADQLRTAYDELERRFQRMKSLAEVHVPAIGNALTLQQSRHLVVGVASDTFDEVERGQEPVIPFHAAHYNSKVVKGSKEQT